MKFSTITNERLLLLLIVVLGFGLRIFNLNWDNGHFLHPDERLFINASTLSFPTTLASFLSPESPLNPNMFYYGSFPLYLYKIIQSYFFPTIDILIASRFMSALLSAATTIFIFHVAKVLFNQRVALLSSIIYIFIPGSIQHAHFNTTESMLIFFLSVILYFSIQLYRNYSYGYITLLALVSGLAIATKITALTFLLLPAIALLLLIKEHFSKVVIGGIILLVLTAGIAIICAPYQLIDWEQFYHEQTYMQGVILGKSKPPFTIIYENSIPYLYPLTQVMPFIFGFVTFPLAIVGLYLTSRRVKKNLRKNLALLFLIIFPIIYFLWVGGWYAKFTRYYILLVPFMCLFAGYALSKLKHRKLIILFILLIAANGMLFFRIYLFPHTRIAASEWIYGNIPQGSIISGEHWDDNLPLPLKDKSYPDYTMLQLAVYDPDDITKIQQLASSLHETDYLILSSRRVYQSILNNPDLYPYTTAFYHKLFDEKLGFVEIKRFSSYPFLFSDDIADESFQSYDHPPVIIFQNEQKLSSEELFTTLTNLDES